MNTPIRWLIGQTREQRLEELHHTLSAAKHIRNLIRANPALKCSCLLPQLRSCAWLVTQLFANRHREKFVLLHPSSVPGGVA